MALEALGVLGVLLTPPQGPPGIENSHQTRKHSLWGQGGQAGMRLPSAPAEAHAHLLALGAHVSWGSWEALRPSVTLEDRGQAARSGRRHLCASVPSPPKHQVCGFVP